MEEYEIMEAPKKMVSLGMSKVAEPAALVVDANAPLEERIIAALKTCYDPELPVNIYELGLIYELRVEPSGAVFARMTLTSPGCPVAGSLVKDVQKKIEGVAGVTSAQVELVWDPPWDKSRMSEAAQLELGLF